ncbi:hypothetical protein ET475_06185 [Microbacterium protaetiae]|uniref:Uncharacterized protein n=1 Tax=Microbacterium protaetiae TaxID=2509458 RepID=A0A4P6ENX6_9MICO|nr:hypothetical protein [Microbacterium protaetiae]QAY59618.1 hypothetical protein ET475_06185 [Microbacterium protaetiae]
MAIPGVSLGVSGLLARVVLRAERPMSMPMPMPVPMPVPMPAAGRRPRCGIRPPWRPVFVSQDGMAIPGVSPGVSGPLARVVLRAERLGAAVGAGRRPCQAPLALGHPARAVVFGPGRGIPPVLRHPAPRRCIRPAASARAAASGVRLAGWNGDPGRVARRVGALGAGRPAS